MAISSYGVTLKWGTSASDVAKVIDVKDFPDLIGEVNLLETTTLSDAQQTNIPGIKQSSTLSFTYNYTSADFAKVEADANKPLFYALEFSDGSKFTWEGQHTSGLPGKGVDEVIDATVNIAASTPVTFVAASA
jgi:hypothetical protein